MYKIIQEGKAKIYVPEESKISRKLPVFYNPVMKENRDISVLLLKSERKKDMSIADPLAGTGVRSIRLLLELSRQAVGSIFINDISQNAVKLIRKNLTLNKLRTGKRIALSNQDAGSFLLQGNGFDYIDIDPFGYPGPFLSPAIARLSRGGILAVTATDTSALAGSSPKACIRKYWSTPLKDGSMHETGLRILIRLVQLVGSMHEKALLPIFCYCHAHYMRAFFRCSKGKQRIDALLSRHGFFRNAGPLWTGRLWEEELVEKMNIKPSPGVAHLITTISGEAGVGTVGFFDLPWICKQEHIPLKMKLDATISLIRSCGHSASRTHFNPEGIRSDIPLENLIEILKRD